MIKAQALFSDSLSVPIGFATFPLFTLSTISYDEFDNGNAFLFSLPITRAGYVVEKYCFALILALSAWTISTLLVVIAGTAGRWVSPSCPSDPGGHAACPVKIRGEKGGSP